MRQSRKTLANIVFVNNTFVVTGPNGEYFEGDILIIGD